MKNNAFIRFFRAFAVAVALLLIQGCASNGYISSSITTGIGLDVSENPQTQIPHVRFGYIRHGLYYIPTGKTGDPTGNVSETPHVVSKIHVSSEFLKGITISEKFAVGDKASNSTAAAALFADTSTEGIHAPANNDPTANSAAIAAAVKAQRLKDAADVGTTRVIRDPGKLDEARKARAEQKAKETDIKAWNQAIGKLEDTAPMWRDKNSADEAKMKPIFQALLAEQVLSDANLPTRIKTDLDSVSDFFEKIATPDQRKKLLLAARSQAAKSK